MDPHALHELIAQVGPAVSTVAFLQTMVGGPHRRARRAVVAPPAVAQASEALAGLPTKRGGGGLDPVVAARPTMLNPAIPPPGPRTRRLAHL